MEKKFNGEFGIFEVDKVVRKSNFYELTFKNDKRRFSGCHLNSFTKESGEAKSLIELNSGDRIWIDISAHTADKSLFVYNPFGTKAGIIE
jgi:hypothetical protein